MSTSMLMRLWGFVKKTFKSSKTPINITINNNNNGVSATGSGETPQVTETKGRKRDKAQLPGTKVNSNSLQALNDAAYRGNFAATARLIIEQRGEEEFKKLVVTPIRDGWNCLHHAAAAGKLSNVVLFMKDYFNNEELSNCLVRTHDDGGTVLNVAAYSGKFESTADIMFELLGKQKFKELVFQQNSAGWNCFNHAAETEHLDDVIAFMESHFSEDEIKGDLADWR